MLKAEKKKKKKQREMGMGSTARCPVPNALTVSLLHI
jgi:hypothetical protein